MGGEGPLLTVDEVLSRIGFGRFHIFLFILGAIFKATESIEMFIVSIVAPILTCIWNMTAVEAGALTAAIFFGLIFGGLVWGSASDLYGRRAILMLTSTLVVVYGCLSSLSPNFGWLLVLRMILAFFLNGVLITTMSYVLEFCPIAYRGKVIVCLCVCWPVGGIIMAGVSYISMRIFSWRVMLLTNTVPLVIPIILILFFPLSPHFLLTNGKKEEAKKVLDIVRRMNNVKFFDYDLIEPGKAVRTQLKELFNRKFASTIACLLVLYFGQGIVYIGHVLIIVLLPLHHHSCLTTAGLQFFEPKSLFDDSCCNPPTDSTFVSIVVASLGEIGSIIVTYPLIDRIGRRKTLTLAAFLASLSFLLLGICTGSILINIFFAVSRVVVSAFTITLLLYTLEVFPTSVRNLGMGFCEITSFLGSVLTSFIAQVYVSNGNGLSVVLFYAAVLFALSIFSCLLPYETAAQPLKDVTSETDFQETADQSKLLPRRSRSERDQGDAKKYGTQ